MKKNKWKLIVSCIGLIGLTGCASVTKTTQNTIPTPTKKNTPIVITELGTTKSIPTQTIQNRTVEFKQITWKNDIPKESRFVLVSANDSFTKKEKQLLKKDILNKKVVLFYGENVQPKQVIKELSLNIPPIQVKGDANVYYILYGYGYSKEKKKDMTLFLGANEITQVNSQTLAQFFIDNNNF